MAQFNIFGQAEEAGANLPPDMMQYLPRVFGGPESADLMASLLNNISWKQEILTMYGKQLNTPRLTAWYGDTQSSYRFSGTTFQPLPWIPDLLLIKNRIEPLCKTAFNSVLLNYYRDGNDSVAWHSDDEPELGINPIIASVSFGQTRRFDVRNKTNHQQKYQVPLADGSLLVMKGPLQHQFEHQIAKTTRAMKGRINLTFRVINK